MPADFFGHVMVVFNRYGMSMLQGVNISFKIALVGILMGCIIGLVMGIVQTIPNERGDNPIERAVLWVTRPILNAYVGFFRSTSMMAQTMFIYHGPLPMLGVDISIWDTAYFILSVDTGAYMAEVVRGGVFSVDPGQTEEAKAVGMTHVQTMLYVILPQTLRSTMSQISNSLIISIKGNCMLSVIGITELLYKTKAAAGVLCMNFKACIITMIIYFIMTFTCSRILRWWENEMDDADNYDLATTGTLVHTSGMYRFPDGKDKKKEDVRRKETGY